MSDDVINPLTPIRDLHVMRRLVEGLKPNPNNPRTHSEKQLRLLMRVITQFGFLIPILITSAGRLIAGHARLEAAKRLGLLEVPTICIENLSDAEIRALAVADNRLIELAEWDKKKLAAELLEIQTIDMNFEMELTGFELPEIDLMIQDLSSIVDPLDEAPEIEVDEPIITCSGDLWLLGVHKLACSDARLQESYVRLMAGQQARMIFTDPPYNVLIGGHVSGLGAVRHDEFAMASGEMSPESFINFLTTVFTLLGYHSLPGSLHYICMDWRHIGELLAAGNAVYSALKNLCVWNKDNGGMGSMYRSKHELVFVFKYGQAPHINNVQLGRHGRYRTNVRDYPGVNSFGGKRREELRLHPTVKPVSLVADAILDASHRGDLILDAFGGAGTTLLAAERTGRCARVIEIEPRYVDVSIQRWQQATESTAVHADTGLTFDEIAAQRTNPYCSAVASSTRSEVFPNV